MTERCVINPAEVGEPHIHVVAAVVFDPESPRRFLITQRPKGKHLESLWEFPGGKLEAGESRWQGLRRELREELGIDAVAGDALVKVYYRYPECNVLLDVWRVTEFGGEASARENQRLAWIDVDDVDDYDFPPADEPVLALIKNSAIV